MMFANLIRAITFNNSPWDEDNNSDNIFTRNAKKNRPNPLKDFNFNFNFGDFNKSTIGAILGAIIVLWLANGIYKVNERQQAIVLRFGKYVRTAGPGLNYHLPSPIETVLIEEVNAVRRIEIGYRSANPTSSNPLYFGKSQNTENIRYIPEESTMLTGDENIINLTANVMWRIKDLEAYIFNIKNPENTVKMASESALREVIGKAPIASVLADQKVALSLNIKNLAQSILDNYGSGIEINDVLLLKAEPPTEVIEAYRDVQSSRADKVREINQAEAYRNSVLPNARGEAERMIQAAEGYKQGLIARAEGEAKRFNSILEQYNKNKAVFRDRMYIEMMEKVLANRNKTIVSSEGYLPHLALPNKTSANNKEQGDAAQ